MLQLEDRKRATAQMERGSPGLEPLARACFMQL